MGSIPHPIPYQGSKRKLAAEIIRWLPDDFDTLVEPFVGSGAVSLSVASQGQARGFVFNDVNAALMKLWEAIIKNPDALAQDYQTLWLAQQNQEKIFYQSIRDQFNQTQRPDHFLYLLARCVKAAVRYNANGEFNQSADNRRKGAQPDTMRQRIVGASKLLQYRVTLQTGDYQEVLKSARAADVVYLDPPYQGVGRKRDPRYINGLEVVGFVEALHDLNSRGISYILSYDGHSGSKRYGVSLPETLNLFHLHVHAGRSSQATLLGRTQETVESLYLSPALLARLNKPISSETKVLQPELFTS